ncbi:hypothetical protein [Enterococcus sp. AZ189]|uniref:hypothetical protein n=1 Tax=Enterococcus sp. AZ189 TaxID=2774871 RepID=UPI003F23EA08
MGFGQWKPQQPSMQSEAFYVNQSISFMYRKKNFVGKIEKLLTNSAIVSLPLNSPKDILEKTVISYTKLIVV